MNLHGQDTLSLVSIGLVNHGLAEAVAGGRIASDFDYREGPVRLAGRFGPWRIVRGGGARLLHVAIPVAEASLSGFGDAGEANISGVVITVEIGLRFVPAPRGRPGRELHFDLDLNANRAASPVTPLSIDDPAGVLLPLVRSVLEETIPGCLAAHLDRVSYVFATVGTGTTGGLAMPFIDWRYLETGDGRAFLAIMGALAQPPDDAVDPAVLRDGATAALIVSKRAFLQRLLQPYLQQGFKPRAGFAYHAGSETVGATAPIRLPELNHGVWWVKPMITALTFALGPNQLVCTAVTKSEMPLWTTFNCTVTPRMPFVLNDHRVAFQPDPHPQETHSVGLPGVLDLLIGWFVNWLLGFFVKPINDMVTAIARQMQMLNTPQQQPVQWSGIREFRADAAELGDCFWIADRRADDTGSRL